MKFLKIAFKNLVFAINIDIIWRDFWWFSEEFRFSFLFLYWKWNQNLKNFLWKLTKFAPEITCFFFIHVDDFENQKPQFRCFDRFFVFWCLQIFFIKIFSQNLAPTFFVSLALNVSFVYSLAPPLFFGRASQKKV